MGSSDETIHDLKGKPVFEHGVWTFNRRCRLHLTPRNLVLTLIERTFRYTYMIATKMRGDMIDDGQAEQLERLIEEARNLQNTLRYSPPE